MPTFVRTLRASRLAASSSRLAGARIRMRPLPQARVDEARAVRDVPVVHRRVARRLDVRARIACPGNAPSVTGVYGGRNVVVPTCGNRHAERLGQQREPDDVAGLALVGAHAERRVALQVLDRAVALARGERDVADGDVVLQVDEALVAVVAAPGRPTAAAAAPAGRRRGVAGATAQPSAGAAEPRRAAAASAGAWPSASAAASAEAAVARRPAATIGSGDASGTKVAQRVVVAQRAARLREEVHGRIPAARHGDEIAVERARRAAARAATTSTAGRRAAAVRARTIDAAVERSAGRRRARAAAARPSSCASGTRRRRSPAIATPASCSASAAAYALSLLANTTAREPGRTP